VKLVQPSLNNKSKSEFAALPIYHVKDFENTIEVIQKKSTFSQILSKAIHNWKKKRQRIVPRILLYIRRFSP